MTSLVPYKSLCIVLASFVPDVLKPVIRSSVTVPRKENRLSLLSTSSLPLSRHLPLVQSIQLLYTYLQKYFLSLFLIVHHLGSCRPTQHKVVRKLLLTAVCGRPLLLLACRSPASQFAWPPLKLTSLLQVFHLLYSFLKEQCSGVFVIQDTHGLRLWCVPHLYLYVCWSSRCSNLQFLVLKTTTRGMQYEPLLYTCAFISFVFDFPSSQGSDLPVR